MSIRKLRSSRQPTAGRQSSPYKSSSRLDFVIDQLERRQMLAADVKVTGANVRVTGEDTADNLAIYLDDTTQTVWIDDGMTLQDTRLAAIAKLTVNLKDSGTGTDSLTIGDQVQITKTTAIKLGNGTNRLTLGGLHRTLNVSGGKGADNVVLNGGLGTSRNSFNLKAGDDKLTFAIDAYIAAASGDTPLADYLETLPTDIRVLDGLALIKSNLGSGDDLFQVLYEGESVTASQMLMAIGSLGLGDYGSLDEAVVGLEAAAEAAGIRRLRITNINGAKGDDSMIPGSFSEIVDFLGSHRGFENFTDPPVVTAGLQNDTAAFGQTNSDGLTSDATIQGATENAAEVTVSVDGGPAISATLATDGTFVFDPGLATDGSQDGVHVALVTARNAEGVSSTSELTFTLDTLGPTAATLELGADFDDGTPNDQRTTFDLVSLLGTADPESVGLLVEQGLPIDIGTDGNFAMNGVPLTLGKNVIVGDFFDAAGNVTRAELTVERDAPTGSIQLAEDGSFVVEQDLAIDLGQTEGARRLRFKLDAFFDPSDGASLHDVFSIYVLDVADPSQTLLDRGENGTSIFSFVDGQADFVPGVVQYDGEFIEIDLTSLGDMTMATLRFQLLNHDADNGTQIAISELSNTVDPEGIAAPVFGATAEPAMPGEAIADYESLSVATDVDVEWSNVRFDATTGNYTAELQLRTTGANLGRQAAVAFGNLPAGVTLLNASGSNMAGDPYLNLTPLTPSGGLRASQPTQKVLVEFANPANLPFVLQPVVYTGLPNTAPTIGPIGPITIMPGDVVEVPVQIDDVDGDSIQLSVQSSEGMPTTMLRADRTLVFTPKPDEVGSYSFMLIADDGDMQTTETVSVEVVADPVTTTRISGSILNTNEEPLAGVLIELGSFQTTTDASGHFVLDLGSTTPAMDDALFVRGELLAGSEAYPFIAEKMHLLLDEVLSGHNNDLGRPIYLPALDVANGETIDPNVDTTVSVALQAGEAEAAVFVEAGTLMDQQGDPFAGTLSITEVPAELTPAALPINFMPDTVVTIQPGEMNFTAPAALTLPNRAGLAPGAELDLWSINPVTGEFDAVGRGRVSADGSVIETIEGGIRNSSWHFFALDLILVNFDVENRFTLLDDCDPCAETFPGGGGSTVEAHTGGVTHAHATATYQSLGQTRGVELVYHSLRADARPIVHDVFVLDLDDNTVAGFEQVRLVSSLTITDGVVSYEVPGAVIDGQSNNHFWRPDRSGVQNIALQADLSNAATGVYEYTMNSGFVTTRADGDLTTSSGIRGTSSGTIIHVNSSESAFGAGWELAGLQYIVEARDGSALLVDGDGSEILFRLNDDGSYDSPPGHFSTLTKLSNGQFQHTTIDQTVSTFDSENRRSTVADRNGNTTTYAYNSAGQLATITDPVGLVTRFQYVGERVRSIVDPANRVTQFEYDAAGNLTRLIDSDGTSSSWTYDDSHRLVSDTDQRGFSSSIEYDFAGRAARAMRRDGSVLEYNPVQVQGLSAPGLTLDPTTAPATLKTGRAVASFVDGNGQVTQVELNQAGQRINANDGTGGAGSFTYNDEILVVSSTDGRGFRTDYAYDASGNLISVQDEISSGGGISGVSFGSPSELLESNIVGPLGGGGVFVDDLDGDGHQDLIAADTVYFNDGSGGFLAPVFLEYFVTVENASNIRTADMNGDGIKDIITSSGQESLQGTADATLVVFLSNLDGTYSDGEGYNTQVLPGQNFDPDEFDYREDPLPQAGMAIADFNNDGAMDVILTQVASDFAPSGFLLFLNDGTGQLSVPTLIVPDQTDFMNVPTWAWFVEAVDLNGDGNQDLVVSNARDRFGGDGHDLTVMLGDGTGGFGAPTNYELGYSDGGSVSPSAERESLLLEDFNNDGAVDAVVASAVVGAVSIVLGDGAGGFGSPTIIASEPASGEFEVFWTELEAADFNGDGHLDLALSLDSTKSTVVMLGNGDGTFGPRVDYRSDTPGEFIASIFRADGLYAYDFDQDGDLDLGHVSSVSNDFFTLINNGDGSFVSWQSIDVDAGGDAAPRQVETVDVNGDDILDIVTRTRRGVEIRLGLGNREFASPTELFVDTDPFDATRTMILEDFTGDGSIDIFLSYYDFDGSPRGARQLFFTNNGDGTFALPTVFDPGFEVIGNTALGDVNGDGFLDFFTVDLLPLNAADVRLYLGDGAGGFAEESATRFATRYLEVDLADMNNDGNLDLVVSQQDDGQISVLFGDGSGQFSAPSNYAAHDAQVDIGDINGDGWLDLAFADFNGTYVDGAYLLNDGTGQFGAVKFLNIGLSRFHHPPAEFVRIGDVTGDGVADIVVSTATHYYVTAGIVGGGFTAATVYRGGGLEPSLVDIDGDGIADIVGARVDFNRGSRVDHYENAITIHYGVPATEATPVRMTYDPVFNQLTSITDELGRKTLFEIDANNGNTLSMIQVIGQVDATSGETDDLVTSYSYTANGLVEQIIDPLGRVTEFAYDVLGRTTSITSALGTADEGTVTFGYDEAGNLIEVTDENQNRSTFEYDERGRQIAFTDPLDAVATFGYDDAGNLVSRTDRAGSEALFVYDELNRMIVSTDDQLNSTQYEYDEFGNRTRIIDSLGQATRRIYDDRNRVIHSIDADGGVTQFVYDADSNVTRIIDAVGNLTRFTYDARDRQTAEFDPRNQEIRYEYDMVDNLVAKIDRNDRSTEFIYDDVDRLITELWVAADGSMANTVNYAYDEASNLLSVTDHVSALAWTYDNRDRAISESNVGAPGAIDVLLDYAYDAAGNVVSVTDTVNGTAGAVTAYLYDALNRVSRITQTESGGLAVTDKRVDFAYNAIGQFDSVDRYSDLTGTQLVVGTTYEYDSLNRLERLAHDSQNSTVAFFDFEYDTEGRITQLTDTAGVTEYSYDDRDQLIGATHSDGTTPDESYEYDANGNRILSHRHSSDYVTGSANRLISDGIYDYEYDNEGNRTKQTEIASGDSREFGYDHRNRLVTVVDFDAGGIVQQSVAYRYDMLGRRISKSIDGAVTHFAYDGHNVLLEFEEADGMGGVDPSVSKRYLHGPQVDQVLSQESAAGDTQWMLTDHLGSTRVLVNGTGQSVNEIDYDSFGNIVSQSNSAFSTRYLFTGREFDSETGLSYYRTRYFDSAVGLFTSEDTLRFAAGTNLARYVDNEPVRFRDPFGQEPAPSVASPLPGSSSLADAFGTDLGGVDIHAGGNAEAALDALGAHAIATGDQVNAARGVRDDLIAEEAAHARMSDATCDRPGDDEGEAEADSIVR